jgi:hypothetical protein
MALADQKVSEHIARQRDRKSVVVSETVGEHRGPRIKATILLLVLPFESIVSSVTCSEAARISAALSDGQ